MKHPFKPAVWIGSAAVILGLAAAIWIYSSSIAPRQSAGSSDQLTIAVNPNYIGSALILIAAANGYFKNEGLDVVLQPHTTGAVALSAVLAGQADLATVADGGFMFAVMKGQPVSIVATISIAARDIGIVARRDRGIATPADLKGKHVGVTQNTVAHFLLDVIFAGHGIQLRQAQVADLKPKEIVDGLLNGKLDAAVIWDPHFSQLRQSLGENAIVFYGPRSSRQTFNLAGSQAYLRQHPEVMKRLVRTLLRAETFAAGRPQDARAIVAHAAKIDPAAVNAMWPDYQLQVGLDQRLLILLEDQSRWAIANGYADKTEVPNYLDFIYPDALAAVKPAALTVIH